MESPEDQLRQGIDLIQAAYRSKSEALFQDIARLNKLGKDKNAEIQELNAQINSLKADIANKDTKINGLLDENNKLTNEKQQLFDRVKELNGSIAKLVAFKKAILKSVDDSDAPEPYQFDSTADNLYSSSYLQQDSTETSAPASQKEQQKKEEEKIKKEKKME
mmetsp:Transcript_5890/g.8620  ORF Transcript_5890/g.8620 Transcript_5890/m.8620 type:complete len:163 (+) Transcript_5890:16-504(+)